MASMKTFLKITIFVLFLFLIIKGIFFFWPKEAVLPNISPRLTSEDVLKTTKQREEAQELVKKEPDVAEKWIHLANLHSSLGELQEAKTAYLKASKLEPENSIPYLNLGTMLMEAGFSKEAEKVLRGGLNKMSTGMGIAWQTLIDLYQYHLEKDEKYMEDFFQEAVAGTHRDISLFLRIARYYDELKIPSKAIPYWQEVLRRMPDNEPVRARLLELNAVP